jgi:hypothetical protein
MTMAKANGSVRVVSKFLEEQDGDALPSGRPCFIFDIRAGQIDINAFMRQH